MADEGILGRPSEPGQQPAVAVQSFGKTFQNETVTIAVDASLGLSQASLASNTSSISPETDVNYEMKKSSTTKSIARKHHFCAHVWRRFIPAFVAYPMWLYIMSSRDAFEAAFGTYYPLTIAMVVGSMIAGSTPLGGGVVAFPVAVLIIKFEPEQGRDFSLIIQAVGMTAASYLIMYAKRNLCHPWLILWITMSAVIGMIVGFEVDMSPFVINVTFTTAIVCFAISFMYRNYVASKRPAHRLQGQAPVVVTPPDDAWELLGRKNITDVYMFKVFGNLLPWAMTGCACLFGIVGGFLTSKLGSGADMVAYIFGVFVWNGCVPEEAKLPDNMLTASSVIIMASCSIIGTILRLLHKGGISDEVIFCWAACVPIVILGAPLGSLLLTPSMTKKLRISFYVLSVVQLASFGILKIKGNMIAWTAVLAAVLLTLTVLVAHYTFGVKPALAVATADDRLPEVEEEDGDGAVKKPKQTEYGMPSLVINAAIAASQPHIAAADGRTGADDFKRRFEV